MKKVTISGTVREQVGATNAKTLRKEGMVPAVIYGASEPVHIQLAVLDANKIIYTGDVFNVILDIEGKQYSTVLKASQFHPLTEVVEHLDFMEVVPGKPVTISMPIKLTGNSIGVRNGGKLRQPMRRLKVRALVDDIPENLEIDITKLRIGKSVKVGEYSVPNCEFLDPASNVIVAVKTARGAVEVAEEEEDTKEAAEA